MGVLPPVADDGASYVSSRICVLYKVIMIYHKLGGEYWSSNRSSKKMKVTSSQHCTSDPIGYNSSKTFNSA